MSYLGGLIKKWMLSRKTFHFFQKKGVHIVPNHFYSPIPDTDELNANQQLWRQSSEMVGLDLNENAQLELLENVFPQYRNECSFPVAKTDDPHQFHLGKGIYGFQITCITHSLIRHLRPRTVIEIGAGNTTFLSARAARMNKDDGSPTELISIDPYPGAALKSGFPGLTRMIHKKVQDIELEFFARLRENDILFIDSTHVLRLDSDVRYLLLEVLPRLNPGVYIHFHDIFLPRHYPREWFYDRHYFWNEQYALQAFMAFNHAFEVVFAAHYMKLKYPDKMEETFPRPPDCPPVTGYESSFWIKKTI